MINNRQAGRRRGRGGQQQRPQGGSGRPDNGNRIDNRARGNAAQLLEKYKTLARDAQMQGDRVNVEYYLQFADHYFRVLAETRARFEENGGQPSGRRIQGATLDEDEPDYEEEERAAEQARGPVSGNQSGGNQNDQQRGDQRGQQGYRQEGRQDGRQDNRQDRQDRGDGNRGYQQNGNRQNDGGGQDYQDRPRDRVNGNAAPVSAGLVSDGGYVRQSEPMREERAEPVDHSADRTEENTPVAAAAPAAEPRRGRGRPRREPAPVVAEAGDDTGFLASLPPSLMTPAVMAPETDGDAEGAEKPRRRRGRPPKSEATPAG